LKYHRVCEHRGVGFQAITGPEPIETVKRGQKIDCPWSGCFRKGELGFLQQIILEEHISFEHKSNAEQKDKGRKLLSLLIL
jgi:hypothetical protein